MAKPMPQLPTGMLLIITGADEDEADVEVAPATEQVSLDDSASYPGVTVSAVAVTSEEEVPTRGNSMQSDTACIAVAADETSLAVNSAASGPLRMVRRRGAAAAVAASDASTISAATAGSERGNAAANTSFSPLEPAEHSAPDSADPEESHRSAASKVLQ
eukprot:CAMPEP_0115702388 /NCGR_PEP_ID=MMETSP0272-20121206/68516_1 /TAXON_ID=71861 /ORGANISM="Scrippsiella trochoidea, Strain CCMP3099" /LENGTH=159 /DNA_ID=CAMNT_0003143137 /DNA_START=1475 /DNA_END=1954 /DNA_ORIENTATION=+